MCPQRLNGLTFSLFFLFILLTATGCSLSSLPETSRQKSWLETREKSREYILDTTWWTAYQEPELNKLVEKGLKRSIEVQQSQLAVQRAFFHLRLSRENFWPTASANLKGQKNKNLKNGKENTVFNSDLSLSYELDLWQKITAEAQASQHGYQASQQDVRAARLSLASAIIDAWFQYACLKESILLTQKNVDNYAQLETIAQARYAAGKTGRIALAQSRQALLASRVNLLDLQKKQEDVLTTLRNLLNLGPEQLYTLAPAPFATLPQQQVDLDIPLAALGERPDLLAAEYRLQEAWSKQQEQEQSWYPKISLSTSIGASANTLGKLFDVPVGIGSVSLTLPFLQWNTLRWQNKMAETDFKAAQLNFAQKLTTALNEVSSAYQHYRQAQKNLAWNKEKLNLDKENSSHYQARYEAGSAELSDWLNALSTQYATEQVIIQQQYQVLQYENLLYKALGGKVLRRGNLSQ